MLSLLLMKLNCCSFKYTFIKQSHNDIISQKLLYVQFNFLKICIKAQTMESQFENLKNVIIQY